jgi:hypothetical protein
MKSSKDIHENALVVSECIRPMGAGMLLYSFSAIRAVSRVYLVPMISSRGTHPPASPRNLDSTVVSVHRALILAIVSKEHCHNRQQNARPVRCIAKCSSCRVVFVVQPYC